MLEQIKKAIKNKIPIYYNINGRKAVLTQPKLKESIYGDDVLYGYWYDIKDKREKYAKFYKLDDITIGNVK